MSVSFFFYGYAMKKQLSCSRSSTSTCHHQEWCLFSYKLHDCLPCKRRRIHDDSSLAKARSKRYGEGMVRKFQSYSQCCLLKKNDSGGRNLSMLVVQKRRIVAGINRPQEIVPIFV